MSRINEPQHESVGSAANQVKEQAANVASKIGDAAQQQYENLRESAGEFYDNTRRKAADWQEQLESYVTDQPIKALLIAAGVGAFLGVLWKRR